MWQEDMLNSLQEKLLVCIYYWPFNVGLSSYWSIGKRIFFFTRTEKETRRTNLAEEGHLNMTFLICPTLYWHISKYCFLVRPTQNKTWRTKLAVGGLVVVAVEWSRILPVGHLIVTFLICSTFYWYISKNCFWSDPHRTKLGGQSWWWVGWW